MIHKILPFVINIALSYELPRDEMETTQGKVSITSLDTAYQKNKDTGKLRERERTLEKGEKRILDTIYECLCMAGLKATHL